MAEVAFTYSRNKVRIPSLTTVLLFIFLFAPLLTLERTPHFSIYEKFIVGFFLVIFIYWVLKTIATSRYLSFRYMDIPVLILFFFFLVDMCKIVDPSVNITHWLHWRKFFFVLIYFPVSRTLNTEKTIDYFFVFLMIAGTVMSSIFIASYYQDIFNTRAGPLYDMDRSTFPYFIIMLGVGIFAWVNSRKGRYSVLIKILFNTALIIMLIDSISFARRTPLIVISVGIALTIFFNAREKIMTNKKYLLLLISIPFLVVTFTGLSESYELRFEEKKIKEGVFGRSERYYYALLQIKENVFIGVLPHSGKLKYGPYGHQEGSVHSLYFYFLHFGGMMGMAIFFFFAVQSVRYCFKVVGRKKNRKLKVYAQGITIMMIALYVTGTVSTRSLAYETWLLVGYMLGVLAGIDFLKDGSEKQIKGTTQRTSPARQST